MEQPTVLLVDDERNILKALQRLLVDEDFRILTAESGEEGLRLLAAGEQPAVIVSDQRMPGMGGSEFLARTRKILPDSIRIVLTGYADIGSAVDAVNRGGIMRYMMKPWNDDEIRLAIRDAVEKYDLIRQNRRLTAELREKNEVLEQLNAELEKKVAARTLALQKKMEELEARDRIQQHLLTFHPLEETLELVLTEVLKVAGMSGAAVYLTAGDGKAPRLAVAKGMGGRPESAGLRREEAVRKSVAGKQPVLLADQQMPASGSNRFASLAAVPISKENQILGAIVAEKAPAVGPVGQEEVRILNNFGMQAAIAISDSQLREALPDLEKSLDDLLHDFKE